MKMAAFCNTVGTDNGSLGSSHLGKEAHLGDKYMRAIRS